MYGLWSRGHCYYLKPIERDDTSVRFQPALGEGASSSVLPLNSRTDRGD